MLAFAELQQNLELHFPQVMKKFELRGRQEDYTILKRSITIEDLRPGHIVSGPTLMQVADFSAYICILADQGCITSAFTSNLNIHFLHPAPADCAVISHTKLLKLGKNLATAEVNMYSEGHPDLIAHAVATFALTRG